jgi:hypothetical protein
MESVDGLAVDDWPEPVIEAPESTPPFELWAEESLGAWGLFLVLAQRGSAISGHELARDWRGDRLFIFANEAEPPETIVAWHVELATAESATRFEGLVQADFPAIARTENRVALAKSSGGSAVGWTLLP